MISYEKIPTEGEGTEYRVIVDGRQVGILSRFMRRWCIWDNQSNPMAGRRWAMRSYKTRAEIEAHINSEVWS